MLRRMALSLLLMAFFRFEVSVGGSFASPTSTYPPDSKGETIYRQEDHPEAGKGIPKDKTIKKRPPEAFARNQGSAVQINPQNVRHPELQNPEDRTQHGRVRHHDVPLLPNMFSPIQIPVPLYHQNPYYPYLPFPYPMPAYNVGTTLDDSFPFGEGYAKVPVNNIFNARSRSGINNRGGTMTGPFYHVPFSGVRGSKGFQRIGHTYDTFKEGIYGDRLGVAHRVRKVQDEDEGEEIISGKFRPCGGECATEEFLCVGSCSCIPIEYRCDGKADCTGFQDELECGEIELDAELPCLAEHDDYRCPRSGKCIKKQWLCDGDDDCGDFSDETHCNGKNCTDHEFECNNGLCIELLWVCDGDNDCKDNSDEINCTKRASCESEEFKCGDGNCISRLWKCDGEPDCSDGSDEDLDICPAEEPRICSETEFECTLPRCIRMEFRCDGDDDCGDLSDEDNCPRAEASCAPNEFKCSSGRCITDRWLCDEELDCEDGGDEVSCSDQKARTCFDDEFKCDNGNCILKSWVCDNIYDCVHGEDEKDCLPRCEESFFDCVAHGGNKSIIHSPGLHPQINCIHNKHVCDGKKDCPHGEDEQNCPVPRKCEVGSKCEHDCVTLPDNKKGCSCKPGFALAEDAFRCKDIDECMLESEPVCSHLCTNNFGSFVCSCMKGYVLRPDGRTCKAMGEPPTLLFANRVDIRELSLNNKKYTALMKGLENAIALDFHYTQDWIFWSDVSKDVIKRARLNGAEKSVVVKWGLETPGGIAVDWVHNLLFWTDAGTRRVEVVTLEGKHRYVVVAHDLDKPRAIVAHPGKGLIFWTDWGPHPKIERADMDGGNRTSIVRESVAWPNGLTIDYPMERIYWADAKHHVIESAMFDGSDRKKVITKGLPHPFAVTLFEDAVFWTDWHTKSIATANKETGVGYKVIHAGLHFPMDIHSYHSQRQPNYTNHCGSRNGGCSHLCLPTQTAARCVCPLGLEVQKDRKTCVIPDKMLIFARKKDIRLQPLREGEDRVIDMVVPLDGIQSADALALDVEQQMIYWTDVEGTCISRSRINGSDQQLLVSSNLHAPTGLALDWLGRKLYWADRLAKKIEVSNLDGTMRALLIWEGLKAPNDVALNPIAGHMYWTDWDTRDGDKARIWMAGMDGTYKKKLQIRTPDNPTGLVVDQETPRLYWADGGHLMYSNLDGTGHKALQVEGVHTISPHTVAVHGGQLYWTDIEAKAIFSADKVTGKGAKNISLGITGLSDIVVFHRRTRSIMSPCLENNGGCSHLCLISPNEKGYTCRCPIGIKLLADGHKCASGATNSLIIAHRVDIRQISLDVPYMMDTVLPLPPMKSTVGVDVDLKTGVIYWTDTIEDVIRRSSPGGEVVENIVVDGLAEANGIAVDSTGRKVYWTDDGRNSLEVAELDGTNRKVLFTTGLDKPRAITLHYHHGLIFWSDWGEHARIERSDMDGKNRKKIISEGLGWPNGLAIDRPEARLYWNDGKTKVIESSDLNGKERHVVVSDVPHPYGLVIVGTHVYWTDWMTEGVHRADKKSGKDSQMIVANITGPMDIRSVQVENIAENACGENNGGCSHLCLRSPTGFTCACPTGVVIQPDHKTCSNTPNAYLLFALRRSLTRISLDTSESWDVALPISSVHTAIAVDFHWTKQLIYYTDINLHIIRSVNMNNESDTQVIVYKNITTADGLAVDWLADNIYWTDTARKVLEVVKLDGTCRKIIIPDGLEEPRSVAVFPRKGYLFWSDWGNSPKIERSYMDGSSRKVIVSSDLGFPNGLTLDYGTKKLYWVDALKDRIETCDLNGRSRVQLIPKATHPYGLTQFGNYIYWTDWYLKSVERADKTTGLEQISVRKGLDGVMEIRAVASSRQTGSSPCQTNNGGCSHLCFLKEKGHQCDCPDVPDGRPCTIEFKSGRWDPGFGKDKDEDEQTVVGDVGEGSKSDLDSVHGFDFDTSVQPESTAPERLISRNMVVVVSTVAGLVVVIGVCVFMVFLIQRRRKEHSNFFYTGGQNVLAFSNPNYTSNPDAVSDKRSFIWKKLKYDRSQERVYGVQEEKPEGLSLITEKGSSPPPTPPKRFDSINLAMA